MPSAITSIFGGVQGASASHNAADALSGAYDKAGAGINTATGQALDFGKQGIAAVGKGLTDANSALSGVYGNETAGLAPYQAAGAQGINSLASALAPGGDLTKQFTGADMQASDPGYAFRLAEGQKALERSGAASGGSMGGAAMKAASRYGQDYASNEFGNAFGRFQSGQQQRYGMLSGLAGFGQAANSQGIAAGSNYGNQVSNNTMGAAAETQRGYQGLGATGMQGAQEAGNMLVGAGQAQAAGDIGAANSWNGMLSGLGNAANSAMYGGFGGSGGFNLGGALSGVPKWGTP